MLRFIFSFMIVLAFSVDSNARSRSSCPDLTGVFNCNFDGLEIQFDVAKKKGKFGRTHYTINGEKIFIDGKVRDWPLLALLTDEVYAGSCGLAEIRPRKTSLNLFFQGGLLDPSSGIQIGTAQFSEDITLDHNNDLVLVRTLKASISGLDPQTSIDRYVCPRVQ